MPSRRAAAATTDAGVSWVAAVTTRFGRGQAASIDGWRGAHDASLPQVLHSRLRYAEAAGRCAGHGRGPQQVPVRTHRPVSRESANAVACEPAVGAVLPGGLLPLGAAETLERHREGAIRARRGPHSMRRWPKGEDTPARKFVDPAAGPQPANSHHGGGPTGELRS